MYNWSIDENNLKKFPREYAIWRLEQILSFGLNGEKINKSILIKYLPDLNIDPVRRELVNLFLYGKFDINGKTEKIS